MIAEHRESRLPGGTGVADRAPAVSSVILSAPHTRQLTANSGPDLQLTAEENELLCEGQQAPGRLPYGGAAVQQFTRRIEGGWPK